MNNHRIGDLVFDEDLGLGYIKKIESNNGMEYRYTVYWLSVDKTHVYLETSIALYKMFLEDYM